MKVLVKGVAATIVFILLGTLVSQAGYGPMNQEPVMIPYQLMKEKPHGILDFSSPTEIWYDDPATTNYWFNGLQNYWMATRFEPIADFELDMIKARFMDPGGVGGPIFWSLHYDSGYSIGAEIMSGTATHPGGEDWVYFDVPNYTFVVGSEYWIKVGSLSGPPYERYDSETTIDPFPYRRSLTWCQSWGALPYPSPGDNFIRAVGQYDINIDLGVIDISHDDNFFNYNFNPTQMTCTCTIVNNGDVAVPHPEILESAWVHIEVWDESFITPISSWSQQITDPLAPGATRDYSHTFPIGLDGRYNFKAWVEYAPWDQYPLNDEMAIEFQIYTPTDELRYDDGSFYSATYLLDPEDAVAMYFDPNIGDQLYTIESILTENTSEIPFGNSATLQIFDDDGGMPGALLWEAVGVAPVSGWNEFDVNLAHTGAFYIAYTFNTATTALLRFDGLLKSGQAWYNDNGSWFDQPLAYDWCMRAVISVAANVTLDSLIHTPNYVYPDSGEVYYSFDVENHGSLPVIVDIWAEVENTNPLTPYWDECYLNLGQYIYIPSVFHVAEVLEVGPDWPSGEYEVTIFVGDHATSDPIYDQDSFTFYKLADAGSGGRKFVPEPSRGTAGAGQMIIPTEYSLSQNTPNPFNPTTSITFGIPETGMVRLAVYDIRGSQVADLVNKNLSEGMYIVHFDASKLAAGVYFYRIEANNFIATKKMVLLK